MNPRIRCLITLRAKLSGAVYCSRSCLWVRLFVCVCVCVCLWVCFWVCYHDNSKLRASILTKLGLQVKVVTISSWLNFGRPMPPGRRKFLASPYYSQRAVFVGITTCQIWINLNFECLLEFELLWNQLPEEITSATSLFTFQRHLKTFRKSFPDIIASVDLVVTWIT